MIVLLMIFLWGIFLGFAFHCWRSVPVRYPLLAVVWGALGALCFFIATAIFLFYSNHGQTGLYGFPVMAAGFLLYRFVLERHVGKLTRRPRRMMKSLFLWLFRFFCAILRILLSPLFFCLRLGESFWNFLGKPYHAMVASHNRRKKRHIAEREKKQKRKEEKRREREEKRLRKRSEQKKKGGIAL
ncbi:MAG TPA: hypothetical protein H9669_07785 [Firmicutes bacterium]|nr:hypothetical protein [Bacillota bacterium]